MKLTVTWNLPDEGALPKWLRVIDALVRQYNGTTTLTLRGRKLVFDGIDEARVRGDRRRSETGRPVALATCGDQASGADRSAKAARRLPSLRPHVDAAQPLPHRQSLSRLRSARPRRVHHAVHGGTAEMTDFECFCCRQVWPGPQMCMCYLHLGSFCRDCCREDHQRIADERKTANDRNRNRPGVLPTALPRVHVAG
jgi:hypothetical protein